MTAAHNNAEQDDVIVYLPDQTLKEKLGHGIRLERIFTAQVIEQGEKVLAALEPELIEQNLAELARLEQASAGLAPGAVADTALAVVIEAAFAIKSRAGMYGYTLASTLAKSLHMFCELMQDETLSAKKIEVVHCLVNGIKTVFERQISGSGGETGKAIVSQAQRLVERCR